MWCLILHFKFYPKGGQATEDKLPRLHRLDELSTVPSGVWGGGGGSGVPSLSLGCHKPSLRHPTNHLASRLWDGTPVSSFLVNIWLPILLKGIATWFPLTGLDILLSNSRLPGHHSPTLWHSMLIILILLIHATTRQQWNASWQSKRRRNGTNSEHSHCGCRPRNSWVTRNDRVHERQWNG